MLHNFFLAKFKCIIEKIWTSKEFNTDFNVKILFQFLQFIISSGLIKFINLLPNCFVHCGELMLNFCDNRFCMKKYYCFKYFFLMIASISNICSGWYKKRFQSNTVHKSQILIVSILNIWNGWCKKRLQSYTVHKFSNQ